jgi:hypothetical protein
VKERTMEWFLFATLVSVVFLLTHAAIDYARD